MKHTLLTVLLACLSSASAVESLSLAGEWRFSLDYKGTGEQEKWFTGDLEGTVHLPGTLAQNHQGPRAGPAEITKELSSEYPYEGFAWYQRTFQIPENWRGRSIELFLERSKVTMAWLDDNYLGTQDALGTAQIYQLGELSPGSHRLTVRVDSKTRPFGVGGHMIITSPQTKWNGLLGDLNLTAHEPVWIQQVRVTPDLPHQAALINISIGNTTNIPQRGRIILSATPFNVPEANDLTPTNITRDFTAVPGGTTFSIILPLGSHALLWDEFHPALYRLEVKLATEAVNGKIFQDIRQEEFGLREFKTKNGQFTINGRVLMLRGKHDAMVFPMQGHVAMDRAEWMRVLTVAKSYGINHYRFHTCTPPEAAFAAADRVGIYLQPELYNNGSYNNKALAYNLEEGTRILTTYGNHPSFVMFSLGNEIKEGRENRVKTVAGLKAFDSTRLYAQGSNNDFNRLKLAEGDDYWTTIRTRTDSAEHAVRGSFAHADKPLGHIQCLRPATTYDYRLAIKDVPIPVIGHEVGQFEVFPDFREIKKYTGIQKPWNLETFRRRLDAAGMLDQADAFVAASGALAVQCYREDIEACLRTPGFGGFQLLDLQDFPGQGTAPVGILNAFMESKGLITPEAWRHFCGPVVPLARMDSYTWSNDQMFTARIEIAQYGPTDLKQIPLIWRLVDGHKTIVAEGELAARDYGQGLVPAGTVTIPLDKLPAPARYDLQLRLGQTVYQNYYPLWIYPNQVDTTPPESVTIRHTWDLDTQELLRDGKTVLLLPPPDSLPGVEGFFAPDFWCYTMFRNICESRKQAVAPGTLGLLIDSSHPALSEFPTENHSDWQWWDLVMGSRALVLDATPSAYRPIVQGIDNFERNHKLGYLFEARVGRGKLLACTLDLLHKPQSAVARQMLHSLFKYAQSDITPKTDLPVETLNAIFAPPSPAQIKNPDGSFSEFFDRKEP